MEVVMSYLQKYTFQKKTKIFNMITIKNKPKEMTKHISCGYKYKCNCATCNSNQNDIMKRVNVSVKIIVRARKIIVGVLAHLFVRIASI